MPKRTFTKKRKVRIMKKGEYSKTRRHFKEDSGINIPSYREYRKKIKREEGR